MFGWLKKFNLKVDAIAVLKPGDMVLLRSRTRLTVDQAAALRGYCEQLKPKGIEFIIVDEQFDVTVLRKNPGESNVTALERHIKSKG